MENGDVKRTRDTRPAGKGPEVNGAPERKIAATTRRATAHEESKRPWAVRSADTPSWVERIDQF